MNLPRPKRRRTGAGRSAEPSELRPDGCEQALTRLARLGARALRAPLCAIGLEVEPGLRIVDLHEDDMVSELFASSQLEALAGVVLDQGVPVVIPDTLVSEVSGIDPDTIPGNARAWIALPFGSEDARVHGVVLVVDVQARDWTSEDVDSLSDVAAEIVSRPSTADLMTEKNGLQSELSGSPASSAGLLEREVELRESDGRHEAIQESANDSIFTLDSELRVVDLNPAAETRFAVTRDELLGAPAFERLFPDEFRERLVHMARSHPSGDKIEVLCRDVEMTAVDSDGQSFPVEVSLTRTAVGHELRPLVIVRIRDISPYKSALEDIRFFKDIVDAVGQSVVAADMDGLITYINRAAEDALGWSSDEAIGQNVRDLIPAAAHRRRSRQFGKRVREEAITLSGEFQLRRRDGSIMPALVTLTPFTSDGDTVIGTIGIYTDITALKESEREIRFFQDAIQSAGQAVVLSDLNRRVTYWNPAAERMMGWKSSEVIGRNVLDIVPDRLHRERAVEIAEFVRRGNPYSGEFTLRRRDGQVFPALINSAPVYDGNGEFVGVASVYTDISEQKEIERDLRVYKHIVDAVGQAVIANDLDRGITYWNPAAEELLGWKAEEVLGKDSNDIAPAREFLHNIPAIGKHVREGKTWTSEFLLRHRDGTSIQTLSTIKPILDEDGAVVGVLGAHTDIRELKAVEKDLRFHNLIVDSVGQAVIANSMDDQRSISYWNAAAQQMLGWTAEDAIGKPFNELVPAPESLAGFEQVSEVVRQGQIWRGEYRLKHRSGHTIPVLASVTPVFNEDGSLVSVIGAYADISELKATENELRFHKHIVDAVGQAVIANEAGEGRPVTYWNAAAEQMLGWTAEEALGQNVLELLPAAGHDVRMREAGQKVRSGENWQGELSLRYRDGRTIPAIANVSRIQDENGEFIGVIAAMTDISELKATEEELRFNKHIVDAVGQAVVVTDTNGTITYWNRAADSLYGWAADEVIGLNVLDVLPSELARPDSAEMTALVAAGGTWSGETIVRNKAGNEFPGFFTVSPITDQDGDIIGIIGVSHDISERKRYEREIKLNKLMLDSVAQAVIATDQHLNITFWNRGAQEFFGWSADDMIGTPYLNIMPPRSSGLFKTVDAIEVVSRLGEWTGEIVAQNRDGVEIAALVTSSAIVDEEERQIGLISAYADITERKSAEAELQESNRRIVEILESMGEGFLSLNRDWTIAYVNQEGERFLQRDRDEILGKNVWDEFPGARSEGFFEHYSEAFDTGEAVNFTQYYSNLDKWFEVHVFPSGERLSVFFRDVSERIKADQALKHAEQRFRTLVEQLPAITYIAAPENLGKILYVSPQHKTLFGYSVEEWLADERLWLESVHPDDREFVLQSDRESIDGRDDFTIEYRLRTKDGRYIWVRDSARLIRGDDGTPMYWQGISFDVTAEKDVERALRESEQRFRTLVEQLPALTYIAEPDDLSKLTYSSPQVESMFGYTVDEWLSSPDFWFELLHPEDQEHVREQDDMSLRSRDSFSIEYRQLAKDGRYVWLRDSARLIRDEEGNPRYWQGISFDVTAEKDAERALRESEQRFRSLFEHNPDAVFSIDNTGRVLSANPAFARITGRDPISDESLTFVDLVVEEDRDRVKNHFSQTDQGEPQEFNAGIVDHRGDRLELSITSIPIIVDEDIVGVHVVAQDVTLHQELENQLAHQAYHDSLTGLPNRNLFQSRLALRLTEARRNSDQFAVLFFDLDEFKIVNDSLGHSIGDQLLVKVAERVKRCIRSEDLLARLGGDEFTLLMNHVRDESEAIRLAERVARVLDDPFELDGHEVFATTSIGIALGDANSTHADDILRNADMAMYEAKNSGKNRYALFEPAMNSRAWKRLTLESEIRRGLINDEFRIFYQPIVDLHTGELEKIEALVRWQHPQRGLLSPGEFITVAEQSSLILPLGRWVMEHATRQASDWAESNPENRTINLSLNLSARQYQHPRLIEELTQFLEDQHLDPGLITLEITESVAMDQSPATVQTLLQLKDLGVQLALDDFGTGFSAMGYLRRFPIDIIKIDRSFVDGLGVDPEDTSIIDAIMAAALTMNLHVTAEGIETREQLEMLRELGCKSGQGYLISQPLSAAEMGEILTTCTLPWVNRIAVRGDEAEVPE